jgi:hypothetical protein
MANTALSIGSNDVLIISSSMARDDEPTLKVDLPGAAPTLDEDTLVGSPVDDEDEMPAPQSPEA